MKTIIITALCLGGLWLSTPAFGDSHEEPGNLADSWIVYARDGMGAEFEAAFNKHIKFRQSKGEPRRWDVYTPAIGDHIGFYVVRACCMKWKDFDDYTAWEEKNGINENWNANVHQYVKKYRHYLDEIDFENSNWPEDDSSVALVGVTEFTIRPGSTAAMSAAKKEMSTIAKEGGWQRNWSWGEQIGGSNILFLATPYANYAAMEPPEQGFVAFLTDQLGSAEKAQELMGRFSSSYSDSRYTVYRHRADMSMPRE